MHSGVATALFLISVGGPYVCLHTLFEAPPAERRRTFEREGAAIGLLIFLALATTGMFGHVVPPFHWDSTRDWAWILPRAFDLQSVNADVVDPNSALRLLGPAAIFQMLIIVAAIIERQVLAVAIASGPLLIAVVSGLAGDRWIVYQLSGAIYPFALCGLAYLGDEPRVAAHRKPLAVALMFALTLTGLRIPRVAGAAQRYILQPSAADRYAKADFDVIQTAIGSQAVEVDIGQPLPAIAALVELGRRQLNLQWSDRAWNTVVAYRHWPLPTYGPAKFRLMVRHDPVPFGASIVLSTAQYQLVDLSPP
jgi:hypothetical protein